MTIAAIVALVSAVANTALAFANGGNRLFGALAMALLLLVAAWGMWRVRYWAVLGMQALLGLSIISLTLFLFLSATPLQALLAVAVLIPLGALFWFLVKAMARIQMPSRR